MKKNVTFTLDEEIIKYLDELKLYESKKSIIVNKILKKYLPKIVENIKLNDIK